ncbi:MAG: mechanosensitive ion channel [Thermoleophilaceae bacterium]|nr:mechanosensitive ion channel [Thermoleophilaceae bacterium]
MMPLAANVLDRAGEALGGFLPRVGGAILLLIVGVLLARLVGRLVRKALHAAHLDQFADRVQVGAVLERAGLGPSLSALVGTAVRIGLSLVVLFAALSLLGLQFLSESLNQAVLFLPKALAAGALVLAGVVLGGIVRERLDRTAHQMDFAVPLGRVAQVTVIAVFAITAAAQVAVSTAILMVVVAILLAGAVATVALAFGLGGRDVARELSAGRFLRTAYSEGQVISVGDVRGEIVAMETATIVLRSADGATVRVPNNMLLNSVVRVHEADAPLTT